MSLENKYNLKSPGSKITPIISIVCLPILIIRGQAFDAWGARIGQSNWGILCLSPWWQFVWVALHYSRATINWVWRGLLPWTYLTAISISNATTKYHFVNSEYSLVQVLFLVLIDHYQKFDLTAVNFHCFLHEGDFSLFGIVHCLYKI